MKALQQRRKQMAKRAEQTKKKQAMPDVKEEVNTTTKESVQSEEGNKENIDLAQPAKSPKIEAETLPKLETKLDPEKPQESQAHGSLAEPQVVVPEASAALEQPRDLAPGKPEEDEPSASSKALVPPALHYEATIESEDKQAQAPPETSRVDPELITDGPVSDSECPSSHTSGPSADTTFSTDRAETPSEAIKSETPQTFVENEVPEVETRAEHAVSTISDPIESKDDLVPPSANVHVPLNKEATDVPDTTPELENASPAQQPEIVPVPVVDEQLEQAATEQAATEEAATEQAATEQAATEQAATEQALTEQAATEEAATEQAATEQAATEQAATEQAATEQAATEQAATEQAAPEEAAPEEIPETVTIPILPPVESSPSPVVEPPAVAPVLVSIEPVPQDETTPEELQTSSLAPAVPPLDQRRRKHLEPIQIPTQEFSDDDPLLSDDSFMEELRSATVQEARPVSVKPPNGGDMSWKGSRAVSSPYMASPSAMQALAVGRSVSSSYIDNGPPTPVLMAKKINVSSGISSRIKALEKFSSREGTSSGSTPVPGPSTSSSFEELRKRASVSFPNGTIPDFSRAPSVNHHETRPVSAANRRTNSISVTARIVRDTSASPGSSGVEPSESDVLNLQASPLTVEQYESTDDVVAKSQIVESTAPRTEDRSMSMSSAGSNRQATPVSRPASRLSLSSRAKADETLHSSPPTDEKKGSRASRLMRRMSSITSNSRRSIIGALSPPVKEESAVSPLSNSTISTSTSRHTLSEPIEIGEVNVQFPETLLWKRRFMRIDEDGYVVLTPGTNDASARNMTKRYHLTEFRTPCLPDEDMQELPNSILLDFLDGSTLQCACESRQGQSWTLQSKFSLYCSCMDSGMTVEFTLTIYRNSSCRRSQRLSTMIPSSSGLSR
jgi:hypothetical protein